MHYKKQSPITFKNWQFTLLVLFFVTLFACLGFWQLARAKQKKALLASFAARTEKAPVLSSALTKPRDWRFYRARLEGSFDNAHTFLLDNKIFHGRVGYEVYTPFKIKDLNLYVLVDRGFVPIDANRKKLPVLREIPGTITINGLLNTPPAYFALGKMYVKEEYSSWPLRIEFVNLKEIGEILGFKKSLFPYVISLAANDPLAFPIEWQIVVFGPERHIGYAFQWFALALTLVVLFALLNKKIRS